MTFICCRRRRRRPPVPPDKNKVIIEIHFLDGGRPVGFRGFGRWFGSPNLVVHFFAIRGVLQSGKVQPLLMLLLFTLCY